MRRLVMISVLAACGSKDPSPAISGSGSGSGSASSEPQARGAIADSAPLPGAAVTIGSTRFRAGGRVVGLAATSDGLLVVTERDVRALDRKTGALAPRATLDFEARTAIDLGGGRLAIAGAQHTGPNPTPRLAIFEAGRVRRLEVDFFVHSLAASVDGRTLIASAFRGVPVLIDVATGKRSAIPELAIEASSVGFVDGETASIEQLAGRGLSQTSTLHLVRVADGGVVTKLDGRPELVDPSSKHVLVRARDWQLFDARGTLLGRPAIDKRVTAAAWLGNGGALLVGDDTGTVSAYRPDGSLSWRVDAATTDIDHLAVSPDGATIHFATVTGTLGAIENAKLVAYDYGRGHRGQVRHLAFAKQHLASGDDAMVHVWSSTTGAQLAAWRAQTELEGLAVGGQRVATLARDPHRMNADRTSTSTTQLDVRDLDGTNVEPISLGTLRVFGVAARADGAFVAGTADAGYRVAPGRAPELIGAKEPSRATSYSTAMLANGTPAVKSYAVRLVGGGRIPVGDCNGAAALLAGNAAGTAVAVVERDRSLRVWKTDGTPVAATTIPAAVEVTGAGAIAVDGTAVFPTTTGVIAWNPVAGGELERAELGPASAVAFDAETGALAIGMADGRIGIWRSLAELPRTKFQTAMRPPRKLDASWQCKGERDEEALAFASALAVTSDDNTGQIVDLRPGADLAKQIADAKKAPPAGGITVEKKSAFDDSSLTVEAVDRKLQAAYLPGLRRCYQERLKRDPAAGGPVQLTFTVAETGRTTKPRAKGLGLEACVIEQIAGWRFPIPKDVDGDPTDAAFEFVLRFAPRP